MSDPAVTLPPGLKPWVFFDCETSGLPMKSKKDEPPIPADHPGQPHLASLAMVWTTPTLAITAKKRWYVKSTGWSMEPGATRVNGITDQFLAENGVPIGHVLDFYERAIAEGHIFCAFNVQFDAKIMRGELRRVGRPDHILETPTVCAMVSSAGVVKAKTVDGRPKTPRLDEAMRHFKIDWEGAPHTAPADAMACLRIVRFLSQIGIDLTPKIIQSRHHTPAADLARLGDEGPSLYDADGYGIGKPDR